MSITSIRLQLLYIGNDPQLSKASSAVLRNAGYRVRATNPSHAAEAVREQRYCGIILCATLSSDEANAIVRTAQQHQPEVPIISMQVGMLGDGPHPSSAVVVDALQGPQAFIGAVKSVAMVRQKFS